MNEEPNKDIIFLREEYRKLHEQAMQDVADLNQGRERKMQSKPAFFFIGLAIGLIFGALMTLGVLMVP